MKFAASPKLEGLKSEAISVLAEPVSPQLYTPADGESFMNSMKNASIFHLVRIEVSGEHTSKEWHSFAKSVENTPGLISAFANHGVREEEQGVFLGVTGWNTRKVCSQFSF